MKKKRRVFHQMSLKDKKNFFSNDLIERMIRIEQRVSTHFGEYIPYDKTSYYQGLTKKEKKNFDKYLKNKIMRKILLFIVLILPLFLLIILKKFTGMIIETSINIGNLSLSPFKMMIIFAVIIGLSMVALDIMFIRIKNRNFKKHFNVIDSLAIKHKAR